MPRIDQDYTNDGTVTGADKVIGTDAADGSTKNYTIDSIKGYMEGNLTGASDTYISLDGKTVITANGLTTSIANATINTDGTVTSGDVLRGVDSADGSVKNYTVQSISDFTLGNLDVDNFVYTVYDNIVMDDTTDSTTTVLDYGVNVIRTSTVTDLACKLPQPVTGKKVTVVNKSSMAIKLFPSNVGGQINNYPIDDPAIVPNDGKSYDFICTENPLPGEWTWSAPATAQYDFGDMSVSIDSATPYTYGVYVGFAGIGKVVASGYGYQTYTVTNGVNQSPYYASILSGTNYAFAQFKPLSAWNNITKIKVYTNVIDQSGSGYNNPEVNIIMGSGIDYYDQSTGDYITNGGKTGQATIFNYSLDKVISGTPSGTYFSTNIGDPGTVYGEKSFNSGVNNYGYIASDSEGNAQTILGDKSPVSVTYPFSDGSAYVGLPVDEIYTGLIYPYIRPFGSSKPPYGAADFKFKVIFEYN